MEIERSLIPTSSTHSGESLSSGTKILALFETGKHNDAFTPADWQMGLWPATLVQVVHFVWVRAWPFVAFLLTLRTNS